MTVPWAPIPGWPLAMVPKCEGPGRRVWSAP